LRFPLISDGGLRLREPRPIELYTRKPGANTSEVPVGIAWILCAGATALKMSSLDGRASRNGGELRYLYRWGPRTTL